MNPKTEKLRSTELLDAYGVSADLVPRGIKSDGSTPVSEDEVHLIPKNVDSKALGCGPIILDFRKISHGRSEIFISLDGEAYRLRLTRNSKLILTK